MTSVEDRQIASMSQPPRPQTILTTGATGYVGGRLVPALLEAGYRVRCLVRAPRKLDQRPWRSHAGVEIVAGDVSDEDTLFEQMADCSAAYYLVHSMEATGGEYAARDRTLAGSFARAAARAGMPRIIYLGGLGEMGPDLSTHLRSRRDVEGELAATGVPVTTFRAAMIIGAGSASFEILRYLVERLPVMVTPRWVKTECQPIAIADVLHWLVRCLEVPETAGRPLEIGGPDVLPYQQLMRIMAEELHLPPRLIVPLPVLTPRLSSLWINLVTPVSYRIARPLAEGLRNRVVVTHDDAQQLMPHAAIGAREAIQRALRKIEARAVETRWSVAGPIPGDPPWAGGTVFSDRRSVEIDADPASVFAAVCRIGGGNGWYAGDMLWQLRGWMDTLVGGPGLRRGRRHPENVEFGETLDFWRVVGIDRDRSLSLRAEMKLPGEAKLEFEIVPADGEAAFPTELKMTALYRPRGLIGILYWYAVVPLHEIVFGGMLRGIRKTAEAMQRAKSAKPAEQTGFADMPPGYGRARLWLGISGVGMMVVLSAAGLFFQLSGRLLPAADAPLSAQILGLFTFVLAYAAVQLPLDICGGYLLPRRFQRSHPPLSEYLAGLARGIAVHATVLFVAAVVILAAGRLGGMPGVVFAGGALMFVLLRGRVLLASATAPLDVTPSAERSTGDDDAIATFVAESRDEGFTGGIVGVFEPAFHLLPMHWRQVLEPDALAAAMRRRSMAVGSGSWLRGRLLALGFTTVGIALAAWLVGHDRLGTAAGTVDFSLWFTLWSFLGLLSLPTPSRRGVAEVDERVLESGCPRGSMERAIAALDDLQDRERDRPPLVEAIFHPVPSVSQRLRGPHSLGLHGSWDAARTSVYLSAAGLGLLGRAVHCNCGRPALWVFLPSD